MCGRYIFSDGNNLHIQKLIDTARSRMKPEEFEKISLFEIFPKQNAFVSRYNFQTQKYGTTVMKWGYSTSTGKSIINARSETCFSSDFFKNSIPCAIPASSYFEWSKDTKQKYEFTIDADILYLGGIYRQENGENHFVILTEEACNKQAEIHHRQPLVFTYENAKRWSSSSNPASLVSLSVSDRLFSKI